MKVNGIITLKIPYLDMPRLHFFVNFEFKKDLMGDLEKL